MKKLFILFSLLAFVACNSAETYTIKGVVSGNDSIKMPERVFLTNNDRKAPIMDTVAVVDGKFVFKGNVQTPEKYYLTFDGYRGNVQLFLDNAKYAVNANIEDFSKSIVLTTNRNHLILELIRAKNKQIGEELNPNALMKEYRNPETTEERKQEIEELYNQAQEKMTAFEDSLLAEIPLSYYALQKLAESVYDLPVEEAKAKYAAYKEAPEFAENRHFVNIGEILEKLEKVQVGQPAIDFTLDSNKGEPVSLSSIYPKNKLTMIDFWAGWCGPCRNFNPTLVKIYKKYHSKGFEVLGVSLDREAESWHKAIKDDKLPWIQVSDLKYWDCAPANAYCIRYIPQSVFVDQEGNIVARQLKEDEIEPFIKEFLK